MSNIASALKEEIARLSRKEIRIETEGLKKASSQFRFELAALKKRVTSLEKAVIRLGRSTEAGQRPKPVSDEAHRVRFSTKGLSSKRKKLGLSAADMGTILGVTAQTIYNWEAGKSRPRQGQLAAIASLRGLGKRQAAARLEELAG